MDVGVLLLIAVPCLIVGYRVGRARAEWGRARHDGERAMNSRSNYRNK